MRSLMIVLLGLVAMVIVPFLIWGDTLSSVLTLEGARETLEQYGSFGWLAGIALLIADLLLPIPTTAVIAALGMIYGPVLGTMIACAGSMFSGLIGYGACRIFGRSAARRLLGENATSKVDDAFAHTGGWMVVGSRWMPILPEVVSCLAGLSRMRFDIFLLALACGTIPMCAAFATIGHLGIDRPVLTLTIAALAPFVIWFVARKVIKLPESVTR